MTPLASTGVRSVVRADSVWRELVVKISTTGSQAGFGLQAFANQHRTVRQILKHRDGVHLSDQVAIGHKGEHSASVSILSMT